MVSSMGLAAILGNVAALFVSTRFACQEKLYVNFPFQTMQIIFNSCLRGRTLEDLNNYIFITSDSNAYS